MMYRQGDLLFIKTDGSIAPKGTLKNDTVVLGSSITGHEHKLLQGKVYVNEPTFSDRANFYVVINEPGTDLVHPEHHSIPLPAGIYQVIRQREVNGYVAD